MNNNLETFQTYSINDKVIIKFENQPEILGIVKKFKYNHDEALILGIDVIGDDEINWFHPYSFDYDIKVIK